MQLINCHACGQLFRVYEERLQGKNEFQCSKCYEMVQIPIAKDKSKLTQMRELFARVKQTNTQNIHDNQRYPDNQPTDLGTQNLTDGESNTKNAVRWLDSIRLKIGSILVAVTVLILLSYIFFNYVTSNSKLTDELNQFAEIASIRLSKSLGAPLWEVDEEQVKDIIDSEMLDHQVFAVIIREGDLKTIFQGEKRDNSWETIPAETNINGEYIVKREKIKWSDETIGMVEVYVTDKFVIERSINAATSMSATGLILILSILGTVFVALNRYLTRPITELTNAADKMSLGDMEVELDTRSKDEIGVLAKAIERMQTSLNLALNRLSHNS